MLATPFDQVARACSAARRRVVLPGGERGPRRRRFRHATRTTAVGRASSATTTPVRPDATYRSLVHRLMERDKIVDAAIALAVLALAEAEAFAGNHLHGPLWAGVVSGLLLGPPLAVRRYYPWPVLVVVFGSFLLDRALGLSLFNYLATVLAGLVSLFTLAVTRPLRPAAVGFVLAYAATVAAALGHSLQGLAWGLVLLGGAWLAGRAIRSRRLLIEELRRTAQELERARDENARAAVADERSRIARELHDVVAHAVSVMVVQAGAAHRTLDTDPGRAGRAMLAVQESGRQALAELRRLLGVLRPGDAGAPELSPQPGLADLEALVTRMGEAGLQVSVSEQGRPGELTPGVDLTAYRIVQEALTNVLKHAHTRQAAVAVRYAPDAVELEITDEGDGPPAMNGHHGHGLIGMRERAALYGGQLDAGPGHNRGYVVRARLPRTAAS
jgi:signal transduction histidine kinase